MRGKTGRESKIARLALAFVAMVVMFVMFGPATQKAWADGVLEPVKYVDAAGNTLAVRDYVRIDENLPQELDTGWYYIDGNEYFTNGLNISGNVNLILCDGQYLVFFAGCVCSRRCEPHNLGTKRRNRRYECSRNSGQCCDWWQLL